MWEIRHEAKYFVKSSVPVPDWHMPSFLKFFCLESQYFFLCVPSPEAINNYNAMIWTTYDWLH